MSSSSSASSSLSASVSVLAALFLLLLAVSASRANDDIDATPQQFQQFFRRNAKWINLPSGGGSLVSGRGNFRPGFHSSLRLRDHLAEPLLAFKRSPPPYFSASRDSEQQHEEGLFGGLRR